MREQFVASTPRVFASTFCPDHRPQPQERHGSLGQHAGLLGSQEVTRACIKHCFAASSSSSRRPHGPLRLGHRSFKRVFARVLGLRYLVMRGMKLHRGTQRCTVTMYSNYSTSQRQTGVSKQLPQKPFALSPTALGVMIPKTSNRHFPWHCV